MKNKLHFNMTRTLGELDTARTRIVDFCKQNNIDENIISRTELSVYESLVNIIDHSSPQFNSEDIIVDLIISKKEIKITIKSFGEEFDITKVELPNIEEHYKSGKMRGLGIYIIRTLMDRVEYSYKDNTNILKLIKDFNITNE